MAENQLARSGNLNAYLEQPKIAARLSEKLGHDEAMLFKTALSSAVSTNPKLLECTHDSIVSVGLIGYSMKLPPSPQLGYYYMVPFNNRKLKCKEAQFIMGYKGYIQLAMRSGYYKKLNVVAVKEGEFVSWNPFTEKLEANFITDPVKRETAKTVGYSGFFEYLNGFMKMTYWPLGSVEIHADKYSKAYSLESDKLLKAGKIPDNELWKYSSFWYADFDVMALKTVIRQLLSKWGSMSVDMQTAYEHDLKTECVPFTQAQVTSEAEIKNESGSEEIDANFEDKPEETEDTGDDDSWKND